MTLEGAQLQDWTFLVTTRPGSAGFIHPSTCWQLCGDIPLLPIPKKSSLAMNCHGNHHASNRGSCLLPLLLPDSLLARGFGHRTGWQRALE